MFVVTNTIRVQKGHGEHLKERFKSPKHVHTFPGFVRMLFLQTITEPKSEEESYVVMTLWEDEGSFRQWTESSEFQRAHEKRLADRERSETGLIGNHVTMYEVIYEHLPQNIEKQ